jgi:hypothetical protein
MTQLDITTIVAVVGAVTGTLALLIEFASFRRDRARLKVSVTSGLLISQFETSTTMLWVEAVNIGRRPVRVVAAGLLADRGPQERLAMFGDLHTLPVTLAEGEEVKVNATFGSVVENSVAANRGLPRFGWVRDSTGREHKARVPESVRRAILRHGEGMPH